MILATTSFTSILDKVPEIEKIVNNPDALNRWDFIVTVSCVGVAFYAGSTRLPERDMKPMPYAIKSELEKFHPDGYSEMVNFTQFVHNHIKGANSSEHLPKQVGRGVLAGLCDWNEKGQNFVELENTLFPELIGLLISREFFSWWENES